MRTKSAEPLLTRQASARVSIPVSSIFTPEDVVKAVAYDKQDMIAASAEREDVRWKCVLFMDTELRRTTVYYRHSFREVLEFLMETKSNRIEFQLRMPVSSATLIKLQR